MKTAVYVGTFDPFTLGHKSVIDKGLQLFDTVIVGIGNNSNKERMFNITDTLTNITSLYYGQPNVKVYIYDGMTVDFAKKFNADCLIRGIRNTTDFEYEKNIARINKEISGIETVFIMSEPELEHVSSSMVRELYKHGKDISKYVPFWNLYKK